MKAKNTENAQKWPADQVERWPLDRLIPFADNARTHSDEQVAQIAASMREWGWTNPVLADEDGTILAGHGRVLAARSLELTEAPVMVARDWTEAQKRAYVLADNKLALNAGWDMTQLSAQLVSLDEMGFELPLTGFNAEELTSLLQTGEAPESAPRAAAEAVIQYNIVFDDEGQQGVWFALLRRLRERYPDAETIGERLVQWIGDSEG